MTTKCQANEQITPSRKVRGWDITRNRRHKCGIVLNPHRGWTIVRKSLKQMNSG